MENHILANVRTFCAQLGQSKFPKGKTNESIESHSSPGLWSSAQNMADWCNYLTFDVMGDLCFGKAFGMLERNENRHVVDLIGNAAHSHLIVSISSQENRNSTNKK